MDRKAMFEKASKTRKENIESEKRGNYTSDYDQIDFVGLKKGEDKLLKIMSQPLDVPACERTPFDMKKIAVSFITDERGKKTRFILPTKSEDKGFFLYRVIGKVLACDWVEGTDGKKKRKYKYEETYPQLFNRVAKNAKDPKEKGYSYERGWYPSETIIMNVIDKGTPEWNEAHKHTKILAKSVNEVTNDKGELVTYANPGVPKSVYAMIWDGIVEYEGPWDEYDIQIKKIENDPYYIAKLASGVKEPLTDIEKTYEMFDIDKNYKVSSYTLIYNRLGKFIKEVDGAFGTKFFEEIEGLVAVEKAQWAKEKAENPETDTESKDTETKDTAEKDTTEKETTKVNSRKPVVEEKVEDKVVTFVALKNEKVIELYPFIKELSTEQLEMITGIKENGSLEYDGFDQIYSCMDEKCDCKTPNPFTICPKCGKALQ